MLGVILGSAISVFPIELSFLGACGALIYLCVRKYWLSLLTVVVLCVVAVKMPLNRLDREVEPFSYGAMTVGELVQKLRDEQDTFVLLSARDIEAREIEFSIPKRMSRRHVLEKLVAETNTELRFRKCLTGATLLFGPFTAPYIESPRSSRRSTD